MSKNLVREYRSIGEMLDSKRMQAQALRVKTAHRKIDEIERDIARQRARAAKSRSRMVGWR